MKYLLLGTAGCHLCEEAEAIIRNDRVATLNVDIELIDIAVQTQWQDDYATSIPVLLQPDTLQTIAWPFNQADVLTFLTE